MSGKRVPRVRVFAGPNGSGKSTLISQLQKQVNLYHVINPDDLLQSIKSKRVVDLEQYGLETTRTVFRRFVADSTYDEAVKQRLLSARVSQKLIELSSGPINAHCVALLAAYLRDRLLDARDSFSFESVFSHDSKLTELEHAKELGYQVYVYFISTEDPQINVKRVALRVAEGGHDVPLKKVLSRYDKCQANLLPALHLCHRAYIFDNSGDVSRWIAEVTPKGTLLIKSATVPLWFQTHVLEQL